MARQASISVSNTASRGLITEATGLNFPENAWTTADNVVPDNKGKTSRRLGITYEREGSIVDIVRDSSIIASGSWNSVGGNGDTNFVVVQVGSLLYFFEESDDAPLSVGHKGFQVDLEDYRIAGSPALATKACDFTTGKGYLFVTHLYCDPFYVSYNETDNTITSARITIQVRDFEGVEDDLTPDENPTSLTEAHEYNLLNQGWDTSARTNAGGAVVQVIDEYFTRMASTYPSNAQQWWIYKNSNEEVDFGIRGYSFGVGNSLAPKGHYILNWFNTNRSGASSRITAVTERTASYNRPKTCAFFAGRVFYAGVDSNDYVGEVYFSQVIEREEQLGTCYQEQDPTSEVLSDLLATDGGIIRILDCGTIYKLFPTAKGILVFASNGIWAIAGSENSPFKATEYSVLKVSGIRSIGPSSFVEAQGLPVWWSQEGIFMVTNNDFGEFKTESLTDTTIKTLYTEIPQQSKQNVRGVYNPVTKIITWIYRSTDGAIGDEIYEYDRILNLNTLTGAFYPYSVDTVSDITINGVFIAKSDSLNSTSVVEDVTDSSGVVVTDGGVDVQVFTITTTEDIYDADGNVVTDGGANVYLLISSGLSGNTTTKFIITRPAGTSTTQFTLGFAEEYSSMLRDWQTVGDGISYISTFTTGYRLKGDAQRFGQANYVVVYCNDVVDGSAFLNVIWDYGKVTGAANQLYRSSGGSIMHQTRIMLRGRGRAIQFKVLSDADKPFEIIGWSAFETENSTV